MKLFGADKSDHPMADAKEARKIVDAIPGGDSFKALEDLNHWLESVRAWPGFTHEHRAELVEMVNEAAQAHLRRLQRDHLSTPRLSKYQENRLWTTIRESYRQSALAYATCVDVFVTSQKGWELLKPRMPVLTARALHALSGQMKWQYIRYGLQDAALWGSICKIYAFAESRRYAGAKVAVVTGMPEETSAELEFLKAVMLAVSSPDSLLPQEIELVERLVALAPRYAPADPLSPDTVMGALVDEGQLNTVLGYARMLRREDLRKSPDLRERALDALERNADTLTRMVNDVLDTSRVVTGSCASRSTRARWTW